MKIILAGGSGSLGRALTSALTQRGHEVVVLTRRPRPDRAAPGSRHVHWDGRTLGPWAREVGCGGADGSDVALVNLAGELVDTRPTPRNIAQLTRSRVESTRVLVEASRRTDRPLASWVQASTTAIWSDAGEERLDESSPIPVGLPQMTGVAQPWEQALTGARTEHLTVLRSAVVLERGTPALERLLFLVRMGLGGKVSTGCQWFSWIHVQDWVRIVVAALGLEGPSLPAGTLIASAPHPVRNADLMRTLRRQMGRRIGMPTPAPVLRLGAIALRTDPDLGLTGRYATSRVLEDAGFEFRYPDLGSAAAQLLGN